MTFCKNLLLKNWPISVLASLIDVDESVRVHLHVRFGTAFFCFPEVPENAPHSAI